MIWFYRQLFNSFLSFFVNQERCAQPPEVANSVHNGSKSYYVDGDIVIYRCDFGYYRSGYLPLSRCNSNDWSEIQFQCSREALLRFEIIGVTFTVI